MPNPERDAVRRLAPAPSPPAPLAPVVPPTADAEPDEPEEHWEIAELVAALDSGIAPRLLAKHPEKGWCWACHATGPCATRKLAEAAARCAPPRRRR